MDEVTLEVVLSAEMGVRPRSEMKKFRSACKKGEVHYLYINGKKVCKNKMAITAVSESWDEIWSQGELARAVVPSRFQNTDRGRWDVYKPDQNGESGQDKRF